ncbi:MAG: DJ-1 family glyoxalase III [Fusobacteriaceae bacterium]
MKKAFIFLAEGFEIIETMTPVDILRRAGVDTTTVSITKEKLVLSSHGVTVIADSLIESTDFKDGDMLILPGGYPGYENLRKSETLKNLILEYHSDQKFIAAICGAPTLLNDLNLLKDIPFTSHSSVLDSVNRENYIKKDVVISGNIITSPGAGLSLEFSLTLAEILTSSEIVVKIKKGLELI